MGTALTFKFGGERNAFGSHFVTVDEVVIVNVGLTVPVT